MQAFDRIQLALPVLPGYRALLIGMCNVPVDWAILIILNVMFSVFGSAMFGSLWW